MQEGTVLHKQLVPFSHQLFLLLLMGLQQACELLIPARVTGHRG